ncbi:MAG: efflux RND transporter periplasmic adaptor subunit [Myxococcota bacterium]
MSLRQRGALLGALFFLAGAGALGLRSGGAAPPSDSSATSLAVRVAPARIEAGYTSDQRFVGRVEFAQTAELSFELAGKLAALRVDEGDRVAPGDVLAELDTARLRARRTELVAARREAQAQLELARLRDRRARALVSEDVISPQQGDDARLEAAARRASVARVRAQIASLDVDLEKSQLRAPFAGEVAARHVDSGVVVDPGAPVLRLLESARPEVRVGVSPEVAAALASGEAVTVAIHDVPIEGSVIAVLPERRSETRTVAVRIALPDASETDATFREGDLAELRWQRPVDTPGFWLPRSALTEGTRGLWAVYVAAPGESESQHRRLARRPVEVLHESNRRVFVRGAIEAGEDVVQEGVHRLVPDQHVRVAGGDPS